MCEHEGGFRLYLVELMDSPREGDGKIGPKRSLSAPKKSDNSFTMG